MLFLLVASKESKISKAPPAWNKQSLLLFTYFFFLTIITYFLCELDHMSHLLVINQLFFSYFFWLDLLVQTVYLHYGHGKHFGKYRKLLVVLFCKKVQKSMKR